MKALIFAIVAGAVSLQAQANTCASRGGGTLVPKTDYSRLLEDKKSSPTYSRPAQGTARAQGADGIGSQRK